MEKSSISNSYFNFLDRSLSEDLFGDDDLEAFLSDLERRTEGRIDVRSIWDYISSRSELNCSLQFTKLYEPINSEQFLVDQTKQNDNEMEQVRVTRTVRTVETADSPVDPSKDCELVQRMESNCQFKKKSR